jgi:UDP-glucose 6-dehydrogenase
VTGTHIGALGFAFKAHTNDTRKSPAIGLKHRLWAQTDRFA